MPFQGIKVTLDNEWLPPPPGNGEGKSCQGGVILHGQGGKIICDNTLDTRLAIVYQAELPDIRTALFGRSPTRSYKD